MYNLICFPHYTCGGLLSDILSDTFSPVAANGGLSSINHSLGKIGDSATVYIDYNPDELVAELDASAWPAGSWIGTHCWPGNLPVERFDKIIAVTTTTYRSKLYRWARAYHHFFQPTWTEFTGLELTDKMRETAKNYLIPFTPFFADNIQHVEFADVVENTREFQHAIGKPAQQHVERWQQLNSFLYDPAVWTNKVADALYQAEFETELNRYYRYE